MINAASSTSHGIPSAYKDGAMSSTSDWIPHFEAVRLQLQNVKEGRDGWINASCPLPSHGSQDKNPSFGISRSGGYKCFAGCGEGNLADLCELLGIPVAASSNYRSNNASAMETLKTVRGWTQETIDKFEIEDDGNGFIKYPVRCANQDKTATRYKSLKNTGQKYKWDAGQTASIYNFDDAEAWAKEHSGLVYLVEGEPDVWTMAQNGLGAVSFFGATHRPLEGLECLENSKYITNVKICYDKDDAGYTGSCKVLKELRDRGVTATVYELPAPFTRISNGGPDISNLYNELGRDRDRFLHAIDNLPELELPDDLEWPLEPEMGFVNEYPSPLPIDKLPEVIKNNIISLAAKLQRPSDWFVQKHLTLLSAASAGKIMTEVWEEWNEAACIYGITIAPPGTMKSAVSEVMTRCIREWEREAVKDAQGSFNMAQHKIQVREAQLAAAKKSAVTSEDFDDAMDAIEAAEIALDKAKDQQKPLPRLLFDDATSQGLIKEMALNGGRAAIFAPEGNPLKNIAGGKKNDGTSDAIFYNKCYNHEGIMESLVTRLGNDVPLPALTLDIMCQPSVIETLRNQHELQGEGFLPRCLYVWQKTNDGNMKDPRDLKLDQDAQDKWHEVLVALLNEELPEQAPPGAVPQLRKHELTPDAENCISNFWLRLKNKWLLPTGQLSHIVFWAGKMHGHIVRIATHLHRADQQAKGEDLYEPIKKHWIEVATELAWGFSEHTAYTFRRMIRNSHQSNLMYLLERMREMEGSTLSELQEVVRGRKGTQTAEETRKLIEALEGYSLVQLVEAPRTKKAGRPPSPTIRIHPAISLRNIRNIPESTESEDLSDKSYEDDEYELKELEAKEMYT